MEPVEGVALLAVLLREAGRNRHLSEENLLDDLAEQSREVSMATLLTNQHFTSLEYRLARLLYEAPEEAVEVARQLYVEHEDGLTAEALLHANGKRTRAHWAEPFRERWAQVRASMAAFEREGIATGFGELDQIANDAFRAATGATLDEVIERFHEPQWEAEATWPDPLDYAHAV